MPRCSRANWRSFSSPTIAPWDYGLGIETVARITIKKTELSL
jgi:hypothetical protein